MSRTLCQGSWLKGWLVPAALAASLVVPKLGDWPLGVSEALACTGGGSGVGEGVARGPTWLSLAPAGELGTTTRIATDGFLPLRGSYWALSVEQALAGIKLVATDESGNEIAGKLEAFGAPEQQVFGWTATHALSIGQRLNVAISIDSAFYAPGVGGTYALEVVGPPEALPEASATFGGWADTYDGVGDLVSCTGQVSTCGSSQLQVYGAYKAAGHSVDLFADVAPASGVVWEVSIAQSPSQPESKPYPSQPVLITGAYASELPIGAVAIDLDAKQACVAVIVKDLRTGAEVRGDVCHAPEPSLSIDTAGVFLAGCEAPPNAAVRDLWCQARTKASRPCDLPTPDSNDPTDPTPSDPSDPMTSDADASHRSGTSQSCQLGSVPGSSPGAWALCLAAIGVAIARRQRRS